MRGRIIMRSFQSCVAVVLASCFGTYSLALALGINTSTCTFNAVRCAGTSASVSASASNPQSHVFVHHSPSRMASTLHAKPVRLEENEPGVLYVNDKCINCAACSYFAPETFKRSTKANSYKHIVYNQPMGDTSSKVFENARAALAACPVAAIRATSPGEDHGKWNLTPEQVQISKAFAINTKVNGLSLPFPRRLVGNDENEKNEGLMGEERSNDGTRSGSGVWMLGHHSEKTFGAIPYLVKGRHRGMPVSVMVDVPKFSKSSIRAVEGLLAPGHEDRIDNNDHPLTNTCSPCTSSPDFMFLTHVDDTAQHNQWKEHFRDMKRIFHEGNLGRHNWIGDESLNDVEVLLEHRSNVMDEKLIAMSLDGLDVKEIDCQLRVDEDVNVAIAGTAKQIHALFQEWESDFIIFHTPGHSNGSIALLHKSNDGASHGTLFTGDTYAFTTRDGGHMTGFPRYGNDLSIQSRTLQCIKALSPHYDRIACGHGHIRDYTRAHSRRDDDNSMARKLSDIEDAMKELQAYET